MPDNGSPSERGLDRTPKALGRGLGEISHLFLSPATQTSPPPQTSPTTQTPAPPPVDAVAPEQPAGRPPARAGVAVLRPGAGLPKDQVTATLLECQDALEGGMRAFGAAVSCSPYGEIDLLAMDCLNQLTVIDVDTTLGDSLLLR